MGGGRAETETSGRDEELGRHCHGRHHDDLHHHGAGRQHGHHHDMRAASRRALYAALVVLSGLMVLEFAAGVLTNSLALISDAGHLLTDVAAVALALLAQWVAQRPPSARSSFGYRRVEILAALINGLTLVAVAVYVFVEAFHRFNSPEPVHGVPMLVVAVVGLIGQTITAVVLARAQHESLNVRGAYLHAMTDALQSVGVVVAGAIIVLTGATLADPIISVVIGVLITYSGGKIAFQAAHVLMEGAPEDVDLEELARAMRSHVGVAAVTDLHVWTLTTGYNAMSAHVVSDEGMDATDRERLRDRLGTMLEKAFKVHHVTLQVEDSCGGCELDECGAWMQCDDEER